MLAGKKLIMESSAVTTARFFQMKYKLDFLKKQLKFCNDHDNYGWFLKSVVFMCIF